MHNVSDHFGTLCIKGLVSFVHKIHCNCIRSVVRSLWLNLFQTLGFKITLLVSLYSETVLHKTVHPLDKSGETWNNYFSQEGAAYFFRF